MFESPKFTPRNVAKFAAKSMVGTIVAGAVKEVLIQHFPATERLKIAGLTGTIAGWYVSDQLEPLTDDLVDFAADEYIELLKRKRAKQIES